MRTAALWFVVGFLPLSAQTTSELAQRFAGCYQLSITSKSDDNGLPRHFQLLDQPKHGFNSIFVAKALSSDADGWFASSWKPHNRKNLTITWSTGLGGYHVKLREKKVSFVGTAKFWCDYRCAFPTPKLPVEARRVDCVAGAAGQ